MNKNIEVSKVKGILDTVNGIIFDARFNCAEDNVGYTYDKISRINDYLDEIKRICDEIKREDETRREEDSFDDYI